MGYSRRMAPLKYCAHLIIQEERLCTPVPWPLIVQIQQHADQQGLPELPVDIVPEGISPPADFY